MVRPGRLVHLTEDQSSLVEYGGFTVPHDGLTHLDEEVGALTGALADAGEHRHTTVVRRHTGDHLGDEHGLAHAGTTEQADLSTLLVGGEQVDHLDAGFEHLRRRLESIEVGRSPVNLPPLVCGEARLVEAVTHDIPDVAEGAVAHRRLNTVPGVDHRRASGEAVGRLHGDRSHPVVADLLRNLGGNVNRFTTDVDVEFDLGVDLRQVAGRELHVDDGAGDADDASLLELVLGNGHVSDPSLTSVGACWRA